MSIQILGPLQLRRDSVKLDPGPRQQARLLAVLLAREGEPISTRELIDLIWSENAPASALNMIHKYVGTLRRLLEPELPPRGVSSYLVRRGDAYLFVAGPGMLDLVTFRELITVAQVDRSEQHQLRALDRYLEALDLWDGPAGVGWDQDSAAVALFTALNNEFFKACAAAADLAVSLGRPRRALPPLHLAAAMAPLDENVQAVLITTLAAAGQRSQALAVFRAVRSSLAENLGIDPGPALQSAYRRVLSQPLASPGPAVIPNRETPAGSSTLVGRAEELSVLRRAVDAALTGGTGLAIIHGEPGVGKTRLLREITAEADQHGALVAWGHCLDGNGTPSMWPWVQAIGTLLNNLPTPTKEQRLSSELSRLLEPGGADLSAPVLPDSGAQFRLFEQVVDLFAEASAKQPVVLAIDDLQWADTTSLHLFRHLATRLPSHTTIIGALRDRAPTPGSELSRMLAAASRIPGHQRIRLGSLSPAEVTVLIRHETGEQPTVAVQ